MRVNSPAGWAAGAASAPAGAEERAAGGGAWNMRVNSPGAPWVPESFTGGALSMGTAADDACFDSKAAA